MTWPENAEDRPGGQLGRSPNGKRNNKSPQYIIPAPCPVNAGSLREAAIRTRVDALTEKMDKEITADKRFYERWPDRQFRVRKSFRAEAEITSLLNGAEWPLRPGICWYSAVRQLAPGYRLRAFFFAPHHLDCDGMPDSAAKRIFNLLHDVPLADELARIVAKGQAAS